MNDRQVVMKEVEVNRTSDAFISCVYKLRDINHDNVNTFIGYTSNKSEIFVLVEHSTRGSLWDVLGDNETQLTWDFKVSILHDTAAGMRYLHNSQLGKVVC